MKTTKKTGKVVGDSLGEGRFRSDDRHARTARSSASIFHRPPGGTLDAGRQLVSLEEDDQVAAASVIPDTDSENGNGQETLPLQ